jgi:hypothetical protein
MVEGLSIDIISDMTTNIIRGPLIRYTQNTSRLYGIELQDGVASGPLWNPGRKEWFTRFERLPVTSNGKLLLIPKAIVRQHLEYDSGEYFRHFLLPHLQEVELDANTSLVELLKNGRRRVTKKALMEKYGTGKATIVRETHKYPEILERYKSSKRDHEHLPLSHEAIAVIENEPGPDWDGLLQRVLTVAPGNDASTEYEEAVDFYRPFSTPLLRTQLCSIKSMRDGSGSISPIQTQLLPVGFGGLP